MIAMYLKNLRKQFSIMRKNKSKNVRNLVNNFSNELMKQIVDYI